MFMGVYFVRFKESNWKDRFSSKFFMSLDLGNEDR